MLCQVSRFRVDENFLQINTKSAYARNQTRSGQPARIIQLYTEKAQPKGQESHDSAFRLKEVDAYFPFGNVTDIRIRCQICRSPIPVEGDGEAEVEV